jgi:FemAB-related protein (PEP-CTERM system-associated)
MSSTQPQRAKCGDKAGTRVELGADPAVWDGYVEATPNASNYHRWVWRRVIEATYGHQPYYLMASEHGVPHGILPLFLIRSRLFGSCLASMPFFSYGGVLTGSPEAREKMLAHAVKLCRDLGVRHIELRQGSDSVPEAGWHDTTAKVTMVVSLPSKVEEYWTRISAKLRKCIRYARKHGLTAQWGGVEAVDVFYGIFGRNMRNLGTPVYPRDWFANICRYVPEVRILSLWDEGRPVAAAFLIPFRGVLELPWAASLPESRGKFSSRLLYWTLLEWAIEKGYRSVDLGRCTPGSGNHQFKRHWICQEKPLHWCYWLAAGARLPEMHADSPRYRMAVQIWKHLPLAVANWLGPPIVRSIP